MRSRWKWSLLLVLFILLAGAAAYVLIVYRVTTVTVEGSTHYTDKEIEEIVTGGPLGRNSLYLSLKYRDRGIEDVPFIARMDVEIVSEDTIHISVYEKALAGYVVYLGRYMYFDRDGIVVEASQEKVEGVPEITGLSFDHIVLYEQLPVKSTSVFKRILDVTQLLDKYEMTVDRIFFDSSGNMTLLFGGVRAMIGGEQYTNEKISSLYHVLPSLTGKEGIIDLSGYTPDTNYMTFTEKKVKTD